MIDITKKYRTRDGREVSGLHVRGVCGDNPYPLGATIKDEAGYTFAADGTYVIGDTNPEDLIEVVEAPAAPAVPMQYHVITLGVTDGFPSLEEAEAKARSVTRSGDTVGIFKLIGTSSIPETPAATVAYF